MGTPFLLAAFAQCTLITVAHEEGRGFGMPPCGAGEFEVFPEYCGKTIWGIPAGRAEGSYCTTQCHRDADCEDIEGLTASCGMNQGDGQLYCQYRCNENSECPGGGVCSKNIVSDICTYPPVCANGGATGWLLCSVSKLIDSILLPVFTNIILLFFGVLCMLQYHAFPFFGISRSEMIRIFGQGVVVLQLYFAPGVQSDNPFIVTSMYVLLDRMIIEYLVEWFGKKPSFKLGPMSSERRQIVLELESRTSDEEGGDKEVRNKYMDPSFSFRGVATIFTVQLTLMLYFVYFLNADSNSHDINNVSVWKWLIAILITMCVDEDEAGATYDSKYWKERFFEHPKAKSMCEKQRKVFWFFTVSFRIDWRCRYAFDTAINAIARTIILSTAPILLSTEEPMDFIKDCLALFFITKLDDFDDAKSLDDAFKDCEAKYKSQMDAKQHLHQLRARATRGDYSPVASTALQA